MALTTEPGLRQASSAYRDLPFEDMLDVLDMYDPGSTPLFTMARREKELGNTEFWHEVDSWNPPQGALGYGDAYPLQVASEVMDVTMNRRKIGNGGQTFRQGYGSGWVAEKVPVMTGTGRGFRKTGSVRAMVMLKQSIECAMASFDQTFNLDQGGLNGPLMASIKSLVDHNNSYASANAAVLGVPSDLHYAPVAACAAGVLADTFSQNLLQNALLALRQATQRNGTYWYLCGLGLRQAVTGLIKPMALQGAAGAVAGQMNTYTQEMKDTKLGARIDVVYTDYGTLMIKETDFIGTTTTDANGNAIANGAAGRVNRAFVSKPNYGLIVSQDKLALRFGVGFETDELGHDGGGVTKLLRTYCGVVVLNPMGFGFHALT